MGNSVATTIRKFVSIALVSTLMMPFMSVAQVVDREDDFPPETLPAGTVSCFDYYTFGSVQAKITAATVSAVSGTELVFSGILENANPYPIVDGTLYVKIFRENAEVNLNNGPDVIDEYLVSSEIAIPADGSVPIEFSWHIPAHARSGEYQLATFFTTSRKFNLLGLPFTDDIVGNVVDFTVVGEERGTVMFDKNAVRVQDLPYQFATFPPQVGRDQPVVVEATLRNTTSQPQTVPVMWVAYQWDAQLRENAVQEESEMVTIPAGGSATIDFTLTDADYPVYYLRAQTEWNGVKSIIGVRFSREEVDRTRINFPGVTSFPLKAGEETTLFSCLHNAGWNYRVPDGRLELTLLSEDWDLIHSYTYTGDVSDDMMGVAEAFTPQRSHDKFMLQARLYQGDRFIDEAELIFDCQDIDPSLCLPEEERNPFMDFLRQYWPGSLTSLIAVAAGILVLILVVPFFTRRAKVQPTAKSADDGVKYDV